MIELGISTFGETTPIEKTQKTLSHAERIRNLVEEIELADKVGLDMYSIGEHHRIDYAVSAPEVVLAAGAVNTKNIKLSSAVTVLSSADPVRVYQNFATVDALSNGRAELMVGRGSFIESFPLFGYDLKNYEVLFEEKLDMLLEIQKNEIVSWEGEHTQTIKQKGVYPRADFPIWVATGGNFESTMRIARRGLPIAYAIIGGNPFAFKQLTDLYRQVGKQYGHSEEQLKIASHSWGYVAETDEEAIRDYYYPTSTVVETISKERGWSKMSWEDYLASTSERGAIFVGSPETVAKKIIRLVEDLGLDRFILHLPIGSMEHEQVLNSIRLFGEKVAPIVRAHFANKK